MKLHRLNISRGFSKNSSMTGAVEFYDDLGKIQLSLSEDQCNAILEICADSLITTSKRAAEQMTANLLEHRDS